MANEEALSILKQGDTQLWNRWRHQQSGWIDLTEADLSGFRYSGIDIEAVVPDDDLGDDPWGRINLSRVNLQGANLSRSDISFAVLMAANLTGADLIGANIRGAFLNAADLTSADLSYANLGSAKADGATLEETLFFQTELTDNTSFMDANLAGARFVECNVHGEFGRANLTGAAFVECNVGASFLNANLTQTDLRSSDFTGAQFGGTHLAGLDFSTVRGLERTTHGGPSVVGTDTLAKSKGAIPGSFLRGCGLSDWEIEQAKLYNPSLGNEEINEILYKVFDLRATRAIQISNLFISYSHRDSRFVDQVEAKLNEIGVRNWRDIHDMKAGPIEKQIDRAMRQNPTVLLVLSENSEGSDWVQHEVRLARELAKELGRDVLCPVALDGTWKNSSWPKRIMEQITEYNIVDFSDESKFESNFRKLIDGLELFYKG